MSHEFKKVKMIDSLASSVRNELIELSRKGDLDILTLLEIIEKRSQLATVKEIIELTSLPPHMSQYCEEIIQDVASFQKLLDDYTQNSNFLASFSLCLNGEVDLPQFKVIKNDWMDFRKRFMFSLKVNHPNLTTKFVFLECLFRMLFVWHESIDLLNAKKNLRMINHLIVKYSLNGLFKSNRTFITVMNLLGEKFEDVKLRKRLKEESGIGEFSDRVSKLIKQPSNVSNIPSLAECEKEGDNSKGEEEEEKTNNQGQVEDDNEEIPLEDASFLSDGGSSSMSSLSLGDKETTKKCNFENENENEKLKKSKNGNSDNMEQEEHDETDYYLV